jgi:hypothetical protein
MAVCPRRRASQHVPSIRSDNALIAGTLVLQTAFGAVWDLVPTWARSRGSRSWEPPARSLTVLVAETEPPIRNGTADR